MRHAGCEGFGFGGFGFEGFDCLCIHLQGGGTHTPTLPACTNVAVAKTGCNCVTCMCNQRLSRVEKSSHGVSRASSSIHPSSSSTELGDGHHRNRQAAHSRTDNALGGLSHQPIKCSQHVDSSRLSKKAAHSLTSSQLC